MKMIWVAPMVFGNVWSVECQKPFLLEIRYRYSHDRGFDIVCIHSFLRCIEPGFVNDDLDIDMSHIPWRRGNDHRQFVA